MGRFPHPRRRPRQRNGYPENSWTDQREWDLVEEATGGDSSHSWEDFSVGALGVQRSTGNPAYIRGSFVDRIPCNDPSVLHIIVPVETSADLTRSYYLQSISDLQSDFRLPEGLPLH